MYIQRWIFPVLFLLTLVTGGADATTQGTLSPLPAVRNGFVVISHRGNHVKVPENTIASIQEAIRVGADYVEIDLRTTKDGHLVLSHDATVDRMTDGKGKVRDLSFEEIEKLKVGKDEQAMYRIPAFRDVLKVCKGSVNIYLDFKDADVGETFRQIKAAGMEKQVVVYLNRTEQYAQWKKVAPAMPLMGSLPEEVKTPEQFRRWSDHTPLEVLDNVYDTVLQMIAREKGIALWLDVESAGEGPVLWDKTLAWNIQGLQTDHPEALVEYLQQTYRRNGRGINDAGHSTVGMAPKDNRTYAERLGWPKGAKVIILHVDDAGMSINSNEGTINSIEKGVATSTSIMMPCPWAASFAKYAAEKGYDAGLHLTLTSEWNHYRWGPLSGVKQAPGLTDKEWCLWPEVEDVVKHASADEVEMEIRAQLARALSLGLHPTHLDSHMGTLFATQAYLERYIKVGIENKIPVMFPGGNDKLLMANLKGGGDLLKDAPAVGEMIWKAGLPVLDDLVTYSGDWKPQPVDGKITPEAYGKYKVRKLEEAIDSMQPGVAMFIVHSSVVTEDFRHISASGDSRNADMLAMMDPDLKEWIRRKGIILTTWREMMQRRGQVQQP